MLWAGSIAGIPALLDACLFTIGPNRPGCPPVIGHELVNLVDWTGAELGQYVAHVSKGVDFVPLARCDKAAEGWLRQDVRGAEILRAGEG